MGSEASVPTRSARSPRRSGFWISVTVGIVTTLVIVGLVYTVESRLPAGWPFQGCTGHCEVRFVELGLPSTTPFSVTLGGKEQSGYGSVQFSEPNGEYTYTIGSVPDYTSDLSSGLVVVNGVQVNVSVFFEFGPFDPGMSHPIASSPAAGVNWDTLSLDPTSGMTTGLFGFGLEASNGTNIQRGVALTSTCAPGALLSATNCGAPLSPVWYVVLAFVTNQTVANVFFGFGWTGAIVPVTAAMVLVLVSGTTSFAGTGAQLIAMSTGLAIVNGSVTL